MSWRDWLFCAAATAVAAYALSPLPAPARMLATALLVPLPVLSIMQARSLLTVDVVTLPRIPLYLTSGFTLWGLAILALLASERSGFPPALIGFEDIALNVFVAWVVFLLAAALLIIAIDGFLGLADSPLLQHLLPVRLRERIVFVGLAITAGVTEEVIFRGFLITALMVAMQNIWTAALAASIVFGMLHAYQGRAGVLRTSVLGFALATPFVLTGSIMPSIVAHTVIDLVAGLWLVKRLR